MIRFVCGSAHLGHIPCGRIRQHKGNGMVLEQVQNLCVTEEIRLKM